MPVNSLTVAKSNADKNSFMTILHQLLLLFWEFYSHHMSLLSATLDLSVILAFIFYVLATQ